MAVDTMTSSPATVDESVPTRFAKPGTAFTVLGLLLVVIAFAVVSSGDTTTIAFDRTLTDLDWALPTTVFVAVLGAITAASGVWMLAGMPKRRLKLVSGIAVTAFVLGLLFWAYSQPGTVFRAESILAGALFLSLPYLFGALSGVVCERSGVINIGIEGQFLMGAFTGVLVANITGNVYAGMVGAMLAGFLSTMLLALLATKYQVNQVVVGVNRYQTGETHVPELLRVSDEVGRRQAERLAALRARRDDGRWTAAMDAIERAAAGGDNMLPPVLAAVEAEAKAIASNQDAFLSQRVLDVLPSIMAEFAKGYSTIGSVSIIGGSGDGASDLVGADSAKALKSVFDSVSSATGLDLASIIQGQAVGRGIGDGIAAATPPVVRQPNPTTPPPPAAESE